MPELSDNIAPDQESKNDTAAPAEKEQTVGDVLPVAESPKEETVALSTFLELKKANKQLTKEMKELKKNIEDGASRSEVASDIKSLAEKHGVDAEFLQDYAKTVRAELKQEIESELSAKLKPFEEKDRAEKIDAAFNTHFKKALESMPEYDGVVNKDVIKALSLSPQNANKTFTQIIEEAYGHVIQGKRNLDAASSRSGKEPVTDVDNARALKDPAYFKEVMENPELRKKYNDSMIKRVSSYI